MTDKLPIERGYYMARRKFGEATEIAPVYVCEYGSKLVVWTIGNISFERPEFFDWFGPVTSARERDSLAAQLESERNESSLYVSDLAATSQRQLDRIVGLERQLATVRAETVEECAKIAEDTPERVLCFWDRPGGAPGNGYADVKGQTVIASRVRSLQHAKSQQ